MKITKVRLKNGYKRFLDLTIDLGNKPSRFVALVGPNGSGKSSVLDGLMFHANAHHKLGSGSNPDPSYHSMTGVKNFNYQNVEIVFTNGNFQTVFSERQKSNTHRTIFSLRSPYRYNQSVKITESKAVKGLEENSYGASYTSAIDAKMVENYRRLHAYYNRFLEENDCKPSEAKSQIIGQLNISLKNCLDIEICNLGNIEDNKGTLYFKKYDQSTPFEFDVLSSGEKEVVDILLDLFLRKQDYSDAIFLIDEPELHVNTSIQKSLIEEIDRLVGEDCQIWIATHSIGMMRALQTSFHDRSQIIHFAPGTNFASEAIELTPVPKSHDTWKTIFSTALDDLTELICPTTIVYCEGRDLPKNGRELGFDAKVYNTVFGSIYPDTLFVSSGGNTELDQRSDVAIAILSKAVRGLEILVLKDRDHLSDRLATDEDRQRYLETSHENHRMLGRREIENYLLDPEILIKFCSKNSTQFDQQGFDALGHNVRDDDMKTLLGSIKRICALNQNFPNEKFYLELASLITEDTDIFRELSDSIKVQ